MAGAGMPPLRLVLLWNMHQPEYRDLENGEFLLPWVYLHAIKDYSDMAWHLEQHPGVRVVVNFSPVLLDQLEDYVQQFSTGTFRDPFLRLLARSDGKPLSEADRALILERAFGPEHEQIVRPFSAYKNLRDLHQVFHAHGKNIHAYLSDQYFWDLLIWYHLSWTGETVRRNSELVTRLMSMGMGFREEDRLGLLKLMGELVAGIVPRYGKLARAGRIELSTTPHFHPLAPLLLSFASAREADPRVPLPHSPQYPGGQSRIDTQLQSARATHAQRFGKAPDGVWPAEGAISTVFLEQLLVQGCRWAASSSGVLNNSLGGAIEKKRLPLYRSYRYGAPGRELALFFRDDLLSDLIGFEYGKWNSHDAAGDFVHRLELIASAIAAEDSAGESRPGSSDGSSDLSPVVSVILDGENCWEYYPYNGYYFLDRLYSLLESHPRIHSTTFDACAAEPPAAGARLDRITAGSWVYGNFSTWMGSPDKNHAWDLLCAAKQSYDLVVASGRLTGAETLAAERQLGVCEASDWFWWMGDYNPKAKVQSFDRLFRRHLQNLHRLLKLPAPASLLQPISHGRGEPEAGGVMRRSIESA